LTAVYEVQSAATLADGELQVAYLKPRHRGGGMAGERKRILCIEDEPEIAALISEELSDRGFDVAVARDGQEGFVAILKDKPDLTLCDISVPGLSGFELLQRLNEIASVFGHIPFVFLTALTDRDSELRGRQLGADDYVTKPIDFDRLASIINARLAGIARTALLGERVILDAREIEALCSMVGGRVWRLLFLAVVLSPFTTWARAEDKDKEPTMILEIGGAGERSFPDGETSFGPSIAVEFNVIKGWLEIEAGVSRLSSPRNAEWSTDLLFKKPFTLSDTVELMIGVGPAWSFTPEGTKVAGEIAVNLMFWPPPDRKFGCFVEPTYSYSFSPGHERSLGASFGLLVAIP
jgi:CheY-like chemotaxis protein